MITQSFPMDQALGLNKNLKVDLRTLNWIGNMSDTNEFLFTRQGHRRPRRSTTRERRETLIAATGIGSIVTQLVGLYNNMLGTRFKVIYGYPSGPEMTLAMERGEVEGRSTSNPQVLGADQGRGRGEVQFPDPGRHARRSRTTRRCRCCASSPSNAEQQAIFDFLSKAVVIARPIVTNPGVPPGTGRGVAARLRRDAGRSGLPGRRRQQNLEIGARGGEELQKIVADLIDTPPAVTRAGGARDPDQERRSRQGREGWRR